MEELKSAIYCTIADGWYSITTEPTHYYKFEYGDSIQLSVDGFPINYKEKKLKESTHKDMETK